MNYDDEELESLEQEGEELDREEELLDQALEDTKNAADIRINTASNATITNSQNENVNNNTKHTKLTQVPIEKGKAFAKQGLKKFLDKYGMIVVAIAILIILVILITILIHQMDFDLSGIGKPNPTYYNDTPSCGKVYFTWEKESYRKAHEKDPDYEEVTDPALVDLEDEERYDYEEYEYDEYIAGIVWTDNYNYKDVDNEIVYEAMGVIARSRLIANLPDNCVVLRYHNEQAKSFKELDGTEEKYTEITQAVRNTQGMIITRNNKAIAAQYEPFSYTSKRFEEDESKNRSYYYHMAHKNREETQRIPAKWVDDLEKEKGKIIPKEKKATVKYLESFSLYGARYNIEKENAEYNLYRILNYYFGYDIEFKTIDASANFNGNLMAFGGSGCMWWPIGSDSTTIENGITFAGQAPASIRITSGFGNRGKVEGVEEATTNHKAIDIGGPYQGYPAGVINIIAAADGKVIRTESGGSLGNGIYIEHSGGIVTRYGHLHSVFVSPGTEVKQGQVIGKMGSTGASSGTHLDFQVRVNDNPVNPLNYVSPSNPRPTNCGLNVPIITPSGSGSGKESVCAGFLNAGYSPAQTAGIMINVNGESGFNPNAYNPAGGGIGAYGLFQWRAGRQRALKSLNNYTSPEVQVAYAISELNGSESNAKNHVRSSSTAVEASYNFCVYYERPGTNMTEIRNACEGRKNTSLADEFLSYVNNGCK